MYAGRPELEQHEIRFVEETLHKKLGEGAKIGVYAEGGSAMFLGSSLTFPKQLIERFLKANEGKLVSGHYPRVVIERKEYGFIVRPPSGNEETKTLQKTKAWRLEFQKGSEMRGIRILRGAWAMDHLNRLHFVDVSAAKP